MPELTMNIPAKPRLNRLFKMQYEEAQKSWVLLYPEGMVRLNQSASEILLLCDGTRSVNEIVEALENRFQTSGLVNDVTSLLEESTRRNWLESH